MTDSTNSKPGFRGWAMLVVGIICVFFAAGSLSVLSVTMTAIAEAIGSDMGTISLAFTWGGIGGVLSGLFAGPAAIKKFGSKKTMILGSFGIIAHLLLYGFAPNAYLIWAAGLIGGFFGVWCGVTVLTGLLGNWFIAKRSLVIGLALGFATFGSAFVQWFSGIILPLYGYSCFYAILAGCVLVCSILVNALFLKEKPEDVGQKALGWELVDGATSDSSKQAKVVSGVSFSEVLKSPSFYMLFIGVILVAMALMGLRGYGPTLLMSYGMDQASAASYISIISLFGGFAIMAGGFISEKLGNKVYLYVMIGGLIVSLAIISLTGASITTMPIVLIVAMLFAGFASGVSGAISSTVATEAFGTKEFARVVVVFVAASNIGVMLYALVVKALLDTGLTLVQCFLMFFLPCAVIGLVLLVLGLVVSPAKRLAKATSEH